LSVGLKYQTQDKRWVALSLNPTKQKIDKVLNLRDELLLLKALPKTAKFVKVENIFMLFDL
jgi:hypothetical protein